jgi:ribosomal protein L11 methyltransferase
VDDEAGFHCYIEQSLFTEDAREIFQRAIAPAGESPIAILSEKEIANRNWNEEWEKTITPLRVSDKIIIAPSWHPATPAPGELVVTIDPKMSFGTGYHESTRLMIRLIEQYIQTSMRVLDVGTGTGVLAIVAVKLGGSSAIAIDIDEWTAVNGEENVERNELKGKIDIRHGDLAVVPESCFDMILANIQRNVILELLPEMIARLTPTGILLLSGLMVDDRSAIEQALDRNSFMTAQVIQENEWIGMAAHARRGS